MMDDDWKLEFYRFQADEWLETAKAAAPCTKRNAQLCAGVAC